MVRLRWPAGRGRFIDRDPSRVSDGQRRVVEPGDTVTVPPDVADHYVARGFERADPSPPDTPDFDAADFDAADFVDRTPVADVAADIRVGEADGHLDDVDAAEQRGRDRVTVQDAVDDRRQSLQNSGGDDPQPDG